MPGLTVLALDCFPHNRGMASAVQGFIQMSVNAFVAGVAMPLLSGSLAHLAVSQVAFLCAALMLWYVAQSRGA